MHILSREFYRSSNGDRWSVIKSQGGGDVYVRHEPNEASGGRPTVVDLATFVARGADSPEGQAFQDLLLRLRVEQDLEDMESLGAKHEAANDSDGDVIILPAPSEKPDGKK